ncbi:DUF222 domain-containing protein [Frankia sp. AiPs1]|uniref:HNH endonuclease signature motif containing protein n=1 Tax=Frankia sp. AiPs1 TaxID=573493 RepID=UPI0035AC1405
MLLAVFDRREGWSGVGMRSCAHWLSWRCGIGSRTARQYLAVAHALEGLPAIRAAFAAGTLSYAKVRAVTRVAETSTEQVWLTHARFCTAGELERVVRAYRQVTADRTVRGAVRRVGWRYDDDGMLHLSAVLPAQDGVRLLAALDAAHASLHRTTPPTPAGQAGEPGQAGGSGGLGAAGVRGLPADGETVAVPRDRGQDADALMALADGFLDQPAPGLMTPTHTLTLTVDTAALPASAIPAGGAAVAGQVVAGGREPVPVSVGAARTGHTAGIETETGKAQKEQTVAGQAETMGQAVDAGRVGLPRIGFSGWARTESGIGLSPAVVDRLGCDGLLRVLLTDVHGNPLHLGRRRRLPSRRLRDAVYIRDQGTCQYPGCDHTHWLQIHHLDRWTDGGDTDIDRLLLLCSAHHRTIHDDTITLTRTPDGTVTAHTADGRTLTPTPPINPGPHPATTLAHTTRHIDPTAIHTPDGGPLHLHDSIHAILHTNPQNPTPQKTTPQKPTPHDQAA